MSKRGKRQKASDVFRESTPFLGKPFPFEKAFPQIEDLRVEVEEFGEGVGVGMAGRKSTYTRPGEYIDCSNARCYNGGFSIGSMLRKMVSNQQTEIETSEGCQGYEGSPKGRRKYQECANLFKIKVHVRYKSVGETDK